MRTGQWTTDQSGIISREYRIFSPLAYANWLTWLHSEIHSHGVTFPLGMGNTRLRHWTRCASLFFRCISNFLLRHSAPIPYPHLFVRIIVHPTLFPAFPPSLWPMVSFPRPRIGSKRFPGDIAPGAQVPRQPRVDICPGPRLRACRHLYASPGKPSYNGAGSKKGHPILNPPSLQLSNRWNNGKRRFLCITIHSVQATYIPSTPGGWKGNGISMSKERRSNC